MNRSTHLNTPTLFVHDPRGLPVRQVAYLRKGTGGLVEARVTRQVLNVSGRLIEQWDPRLYGVAPTPNLATIYQLSGEAVRVDSVDAGWRLNLPGVSGEVLQRWDPRGTHWQTTYDNQLRVIALQENAQPNVERFTYANATAAASHNLRGHLIEQVDPSGTVSLDSYSLGGEALGEARTFANGPSHTSRRTISPLGAVLDQTDAMAHQQRFGYDIAGQLKRVQLRLDPTGAVQEVLADARYNAAGQLIEQHASNGVVSRWTYDPANGRLTQQQAGLPGQSALQNLGYTYDRVGNVLAIDDLAFTPVFFANQRVDGRREFSYDSLYQLRSAAGFETDTPNLRPGLPTPITPVDTGRLYNYAQQYEYDTGGNLTTLRHVRNGNNHTQTTHIAPDSNRGVRWAEGDPAPVFDDLFDAHGNLLLLEQGQPLTWNSRDQLAVARLVERSGGPNDEETYVYSQGQRVSKRLVTQAQSVSHVRQVLYLPGLEIRTLDDAEELHVITLGNVRCLHWVKGKPAAIEQNQLRYSLDDHLGSSTLELDRNGALISQEIYYPFGGTAWWAARSAVEVDYKTIRYSGKEMDVSGLYYYGARYYAPWLQRWVSADPGGDVDGLNLYGFVGNNPLVYIDQGGRVRIPFAIVERFKANWGNWTPEATYDLKIYRHLEILDEVKTGVRDTWQQILNHRSMTEHAQSTSKRTGYFLAEKGTSFAAGAGVGAAVGAIAGAPLGPVGMAGGAVIGFVTSTVVSKTTAYIGKETGLNTSVSLESGRLNPDKLIKKVYSQTSDQLIPDLISSYDPRTAGGRKKLAKEAVTVALGKVPLAGPGLKAIPGTLDILSEVSAAASALSAEQVNALDTDIVAMVGALEKGKINLAEMARKFDREEVLKKINVKTDKRIRSLNDLRTVLHSRSSKFTAV